MKKYKITMIITCGILLSGTACNSNRTDDSYDDKRDTSEMDYDRVPNDDSMSTIDSMGMGTDTLGEPLR